MPLYPAVFIVLSVISRVIYLIFFPMKGWELITMFILPCAACAVFVIALAVNSRAGVFASVLLGCLFFALKALIFPTWQLILCVMLYAAVGALCGMTLFGPLKGKKYAAVLVAAALTFHVGMDIYELVSHSYSDINAYFAELSVLFIMAALVSLFMSERS